MFQSQVVINSVNYLLCSIILIHFNECEPTDKRKLNVFAGINAILTYNIIHTKLLLPKKCLDVVHYNVAISVKC